MNALVHFSILVNEYYGFGESGGDEFSDNKKDYVKGIKTSTDSSASTARPRALDVYLEQYYLSVNLIKYLNGELRGVEYRAALCLI